MVEIVDDVFLPLGHALAGAGSPGAGSPGAGSAGPGSAGASAGGSARVDDDPVAAAVLGAVERRVGP